jgi:RNA polymerase sigma-70 factor (ECF subfamily)
VFVKLLVKSVITPDDPRSYLYRAVRNATLNVQRSRSRHVELDSEPAWFEGSSGNTGEGLAVEAALKELPNEQRDVIVLRIWGGMTLEEAAAVLEIPANTAASRYRYGLARLRERLRGA